MSSNYMLFIYCTLFPHSRAFWSTSESRHCIAASV